MKAGRGWEIRGTVELRRYLYYCIRFLLASLLKIICKETFLYVKKFFLQCKKVSFIESKEKVVKKKRFFWSYIIVYDKFILIILLY